MIISRTPFRISFVGGGTDMRAFYSKEYGQVLSTAIDKYIYVAVKRQYDMWDVKYRINWSKVEFKQTIDEIEHPIVREVLRMMEIDFPCEITTFADIPANTGLGSSSSFTVGLLHAIYALKGQMVNKSQLSSLATKIEVDILKRNMGKQDHYAATYGNMNILTFHPNEDVSTEPLLVDKKIKERLLSKLMLFYTGQTRDASIILEKQIKETDNKFDVLKKMRDLVAPLCDSIVKNDLPTLGKLLHENWMLKKSITSKISTGEIDEHYKKALDAGAIGGKILGAGGGGFLLLYVEEENQSQVKEALSDLSTLNFGFDTVGTRITYYDQ
jgi:D-glycero-alpha-D-manno-heptose-7-phosphate kinase|tara:strand:- start:3700 stop:4680 length:981 start_codon:yes stop_codon:yes gene_type:complete